MKLIIEVTKDAMTKTLILDDGREFSEVWKPSRFSYRTTGMGIEGQLEYEDLDTELFDVISSGLEPDEFFEYLIDRDEDEEDEDDDTE